MVSNHGFLATVLYWEIDKAPSPVFACFVAVCKRGSNSYSVLYMFLSLLAILNFVFIILSSCILTLTCLLA